MPRRPRSSYQTRLVLETLLRVPQEWRHGYDLSRETGLKSGTLYPLLIRLLDRGELEARWTEPEQNGRPPRHQYRLTANGIARATELADAAGAPNHLVAEGGATA
jgi:DNA-binding PadR family transcriptional regulator